MISNGRLFSLLDSGSAQSDVYAEPSARKSPHVRNPRSVRRPMTIDSPSADTFQFHIASADLTVHVSQGIQRSL